MQGCSSPSIQPYSTGMSIQSRPLRASQEVALTGMRACATQPCHNYIYMLQIEYHIVKNTMLDISSAYVQSFYGCY